MISIAVPTYLSFAEKIKEKACRNNCFQLEKRYEADLLLENAQHSQDRFLNFLYDYGEDICPSGGQVMYLNGQVHCNAHPIEDVGGSDGESGGVPVL
ncbi:hypothetical protein FTV88_1148 [Heliorestis convoluta]|uniref:Uncharacterized protein n=1 Tax=Heliorestis convoluta TaxID=356322 RepID=A0A5Q2N3Y7_9FIRM|nr:hypothetical protein FTV88_1148 [Heliorestis convoluta]